MDNGAGQNLKKKFKKFLHYPLDWKHTLETSAIENIKSTLKTLK